MLQYNREPEAGRRWMSGLEIREQSIVSEEAQALIALLDEELLSLYNPDEWHPVDFEPFHRNGGIFVVGYDGNRPVACGALRPYSDTEIELKRMYIAATHRGGRLSATEGGQRWVQPRNFAEYPLSVTARKLARILADNA